MFVVFRIYMVEIRMGSCYVFFIMIREGKFVNIYFIFVFLNLLKNEKKNICG